MFSLRSALALLLCASLCLYPSLCGAGPKAPLGILTLAYDAHLNEAAAFPGLSVFEGEDVSTEAEGRLGVRVGRATVLLAGSSGASLHGIDSGAHVDLTAGTVSFSSPENGIVEIHAEEAFLRPEKNQLTQAEVTILAPGVLQVRAGEGSRFPLPRGISGAAGGRNVPDLSRFSGRAKRPCGFGRAKIHQVAKVSYFVVGTAGAGLTAWGIYEFTHSGSGIESPTKP